MVDWNDENVIHLLSRAGFGAKPQEIKGFVNRGQLKTVTLLCYQRGSTAKPPGKADDATQAGLEAIQVWWFKRMATAGSRRLQEKMTLFWHDHFACSMDVVKNALHMSLQNRVFRQYGLGPFKELFRQVTKDPAMLEFLDGKTNTKSKPNENFGREAQELFALGERDLDGNENYTQTDVEQVARCFTGYQIQNDKGVLNPGRYDGGTKTLYEGTPYERSGDIGLEDATGALKPPALNVIDALFAHENPDGALTMPRHLAHKLWEYFAYPFDPAIDSPASIKALLDSLTVDFIGGGDPAVDFVISDLLRSIFLHDDFYGDRAKSSSVRSPVEFAAAAIRALKAKTNYKGLPAHLTDMGMDLFNPPSVNGWSQGLSWLSTGQLLARFRFAQALAAGRDQNTSMKLVPTQIFDDDVTDAGLVVDQLLASLHVASSVPTDVRDALVDYFGGATNFKDPAVVETKVRGAIALMLELPEFNIH